MRKLFLLLAMLTVTLASNAQFEAGKTYVSASLSGLNLNYNSSNDLHFDASVNGGYFIEDNWSINANVGFNHAGKDAIDVFKVGVGGRYHIIQNGLYLGANCNVLLSKGYNDVMPGVEMGYVYFLNDKVTIEPAIYYDQSLKRHSDYSTVGIKIGLGFYF